MSLYDYTSPPEPEFSDAEWDVAREELVADWMSRGWARDEAERHVDDWMVADQCEKRIDDRAAEAADLAIKRRKEDQL